MAKIHIAKKDLGLDDDTYREVLRRKTGRTSAAGMTEVQAQGVIAEMRRLGWKPAAKQTLPGFAIPADPQSRKILALWISLHKAGVVRNGSDQALLKFVKRVAGRDRLEWCSSREKNQVIEALKDWLDRAGDAG